jgi:hypothetical protein
LPGYCPELNPDELLNQDAKANALGKSRPSNKAEMRMLSAWASPFASGRQVPTFLTKARIKVTPPSCRMPVGQSASSPQPYPGSQVHPRFRHRLDTFRHFISGSLAFVSSIRT